MAATVDHLRSHVFYRPTEGEGLLRVIVNGLLTETKVSQLDVAISIQQDTGQGEGGREREGV